MSRPLLQAWVDGVGLLGPGLPDWDAAAAALAGRASYQPARTVLPPAEPLPPAERRRASNIVKLALAAGLPACRAAGLDPATLRTVFTSSGGDADNCHHLCAALASGDRLLSPTRFHNSVHNAASGYWGIATGAMAASNVLCAFDGSFAAGLLEALAQVAAEGEPVLLVAYDTDYPEPLRAVRAVADSFGVSLCLSPRPGPRSLARIALQPDAALTAAAPHTLADAALEALRLGMPAARALPLLRALACGEAMTPVLEYLPDAALALQVQPC